MPNIVAPKPDAPNLGPAVPLMAKTNLATRSAAKLRVKREPLDRGALLSGLQSGGYVIYFRHGATEDKKVQWNNIKLEDCGTQRNLSEKGQAQAKSIGAAVKALNIKVSKVISSPFCRAVDTARLAFGKATINPSLMMFYKKDETLDAELTKLLRETPARGTNTVLVSHSYNLIDVAGIDTKPGVAVVFKPNKDGSITEVAALHPEEWDSLGD